MTTTITTQTDSGSDTLTRADLEARPVPGAIRPSILPKLAECRCYASAPGDSEAAARGSAIDSLMRNMLICGEGTEHNEQDIAEQTGLTPDDIAAATWGVHAIREIADGTPIVANENDLVLDLHAEVLPDFEPGSRGIMDAAIPDANIIIDYKTGQVRNYREQMAAYCLAMMTRSKGDMFMDPVDQYTAYCVFVDARQIVRYVFTEDEARECLRAVIDATIAPTPCEYCTWCRHFENCPMTKKALQDVANLAAQLPEPTPEAIKAATGASGIPAILETLYDDHEAAAQVFDAITRANKWMTVAKAAIKKRIDGGATSSVFKLTNAGTTKKILPIPLGRYVREWGTDAILAMFKPIPLTTFTPTWKKFYGDKPIPADLITEEAGERQLRRIPAKKSNPKTK